MVRNSKIIVTDIEDIIEEYEEDLMKLDGKRILVTGANGMIPSYLVDVFASMNRRLRKPCELYLYGNTKVSEKSRLAHLTHDNNVHFFARNVGKLFEVEGKPNIILHGASRANPLSFKQEPIDTIDANVNGCRTLLDYAKDNPVESFLFFSSSEVYGNPPSEHIPTSEDYFGNVNCQGDMACYAEGKRFCETLCSSFFRKHDVPTKMLRIFHTFGPGLRNDGKTLARIFADGIHKKKISLSHPGLAKRSYSYVSDTARGILTVMFRGSPGEAYNVGNDENNVSVRDMAEIVREILPLASEVDVPSENRDKGETIQDRAPVLDKLRALGYKPKIELREGLLRLRNYYFEKGI